MTSPEWEAANEDDSDRLPQTLHASASESTESHERGSRVVPDLARVARYAEEIYAEGAYCGECEYLGWDECSQCRAVTLGYAKAAIALADEERAALVAEVERLRRGGKTLGEIIDKQCLMVLDATGLHDWVDEDGDGDWGAIWDHLLEQRPAIEGLEEHLRTQTHFVQQWKSRAEAAEAKVAKVEALRHMVRALSGPPHNCHTQATIAAELQEEFEAVLADAPAEQSWVCRHHPRCADAACSHNPAIQRWIAGEQAEGDGRG